MSTGLSTKNTRVLFGPRYTLEGSVVLKTNPVTTANIDLTPRPSASPGAGRDGSGQVSTTASSHHSSFRTLPSPAKCSRHSSEQSAPFVDLIVRQVLLRKIIRRVDKVGIIQHVRRPYDFPNLLEGALWAPSTNSQWHAWSCQRFTVLHHVAQLKKAPAPGNEESDLRSADDWYTDSRQYSKLLLIRIKSGTGYEYTNCY